MKNKRLKLQTDYEFNRLTKNYLADVYGKIFPQMQHQISSNKVKSKRDVYVRKNVKKAQGDLK